MPFKKQFRDKYARVASRSPERICCLNSVQLVGFEVFGGGVGGCHLCRLCLHRCRQCGRPVGTIIVVEDVTVPDIVGLNDITIDVASHLH